MITLFTGCHPVSAHVRTFLRHGLKIINIWWSLYSASRGKAPHQNHTHSLEGWLWKKKVRRVNSSGFDIVLVSLDQNNWPSKQELKETILNHNILRKALARRIRRREKPCLALKGYHGIIFISKNTFSYVYIGGQKLKKLFLSLLWEFRAPYTGYWIWASFGQFGVHFFGP